MDLIEDKRLVSWAKFLTAKSKRGRGSRDVTDLSLEQLHSRVDSLTDQHGQESGHDNNMGFKEVGELHSRANFLATKFVQGGGRSHLDEAITLDRQALELCPTGHPMRPASLASLSSHLCTRYQQIGGILDTEEAISHGREALTLCPPGHPYRSTSLNNLAVSLWSRYARLGAIEDLNESMDLHRDALVLRPPGHPLRPNTLSNLAIDISERYKKLGAIDDLSEAIILDRDALALRPPGDPHRPNSLNNLASDLRERYKQLGAMEDLDEAITLAQDTLVLRPPGHPRRLISLDNLASYLHIRYKQLGAIEDLNEAIVLHRDALVLCPAEHHYQSGMLSNLADDLHSRYKHLRDVQDLNESISLGRKALALRLPGHPDRSSSLNNLADHLFTHYDQLGDTASLHEAIILSRDALAFRPLGHPRRSETLDNLAFYLLTRFMCLSQPNDKEELFNLYALLVEIPPLVSSADLSAARAWIQVAEDFRHSTTLLAYETSLQLLARHMATLPSLPQHMNLLKDLTSSLAVDAFSACLRYRSPTKAAELLEQGRGVFWSQLTRLRSPVDDVIVSGQEGETLADSFKQLTSLIRSALQSPSPDQHDRIYRLNIKLQRTVSDIRRLPNLSRFLLPSLFSDLQKAAGEGPVIIVNASEYGCDALVVLLDRNPVHIPLHVTRGEVRALSSECHRWTVRAKLMDVTKGLATILREIWNKVVSPIVGVLQVIHPIQSRIWWCPTAEFCLLPLHAAGPYRKGQQNLSDLYISSYTSSLSALIRARCEQPLGSEPREKRFVAIGQAKAKGESELHSVGAELANIGQRVDAFAVFTRIEGPESCVSQAVEALGKNEWVHVACHGLPNRKQPFESAFGLYDGRLTIQRIIQYELQNAEFAYLSACHTTVGYEDSPDEMIHLASAMQFAGFRSVIGTMWAVDDKQAQKITSMFYDNMIDKSGRLDYTRAAFALHKTMREVAGISFDQRILYIHLGA